MSRKILLRMERKARIVCCWSGNGSGIGGMCTEYRLICRRKRCMKEKEDSLKDKQFSIDENLSVESLKHIGDRREKNEVYLNFRGWVREKDKLYFANMEFNGLFEMSLHSLEVKHIHTFSSMPLNKFFSVGPYIVKNHDKLIFLLNEKSVNKLCCYNLASKEEIEVDFPGNIKPSIVHSCVFVRNNIAWIVPARMSCGIYTMDSNTLYIQKDEILSELLKDYNMYRPLKQLDKDKLYFNDKDKNEVIVVDINTKSKISIKLPIQDISRCVINRNIVWMIQTKTTDVYEWNMETGTLKQYLLDDAKLWDGSGCPYMDLIYVKELDCIFLLGETIANIFKTNRDTQTVEVAFDFPGDFRFLNNKLRNYSYFADAEYIAGKLWFYPVCGNRILIYDIKQNTVKGIKCAINLGEIPSYKEIIISELQGNYFMEQEGIYSLKNMLQVF